MTNAPHATRPLRVGPWVPPQAQRQHGVFSGAQAQAAGLTERQVRYRFKRGLWRRVAGRGWTLADSETDALALAWAGMLTWPDGALWGPTAFAVWAQWDGLSIPLLGDGLAHMAVPHGREPQPGMAAHRVQLRGDETRVIDGLRIQSATPALVTTLGSVPHDEAAGLVSLLVSRERIRADSYEAEVRARAGRPGVRQQASFLPQIRSGAASAAELLLHQILIHHNITGWEPNQKVVLPDRQRISVDVLFRKHKLVVEVDGLRFHTTAAAYSADRWRDAQLQEMGYKVLRFTWHQLATEPDKVAHAIIRNLRTVDAA